MPRNEAPGTSATYSNSIAPKRSTIRSEPYWGARWTAVDGAIWGAGRLGRSKRFIGFDLPRPDGLRASARAVDAGDAGRQPDTTTPVARDVAVLRKPRRDWAALGSV